MNFSPCSRVSQTSKMRKTPPSWSNHSSYVASHPKIYPDPPGWVAKPAAPAQPTGLRVSDKPAFRRVKPVPFEPDKGAGAISQAGGAGYAGSPPYTSSAAAELAILALGQWDGHYFNDSFQSLDCFETGDQEYDCVLSLTDDVYSIHVDSFGDIS